MTTEELYRKLEKAYTLRNLNNISLCLINLYKEKQFTVLQKIASIIEDFFKIEIAPNGKGFSKLIMLYHPDRLHYYLNELKQHYENNNFNELLSFTHILKLERIEEISSQLNSFEELDYSPVYNWDINTDGFHIINEAKPTQKVHTRKIGYSFYDAVKMRQYGNIDIDFPTYYLEDFDEFELSSSDIDDLDGVQYCKHVKSLDLSDNRIVDLEGIESLELLEELNLSDNQIENIESLAQLINLKQLYISNNQITDISPLFELEYLDYIELRGNRIPSAQIEDLINSGVQIEFD